MLFLSLYVLRGLHSCFRRHAMRDCIFSCDDLSARWEAERRVICRIRDDADDGVGMARLPDFITIKTQQGFAFRNMIALLDEVRKSLAAHRDGIEADVEQNPRAVVERQADGMARFLHEDRHRRIGRSDDDVACRADGESITDHASREHAIVQRCERDDLASSPCVMYESLSLV